MFTVYSKPACPACDQAKALILARGLSYDEIIVDIGQPKLEGKQYISRGDLMSLFPTARTVPQIISGDDYIGGFTELQKRFEPLAA